MKKIAMSAIFTLILLAVVFAMAPQVFAEEPDNTSSLIEERCYQTYNEYVYPSGCRMFFLPRWNEIKFDVHNGKFFEIKATPFYGKEQPAEAEEDSNYVVSFYTPAGQLFAWTRVGMLDKNRVHTIPHNDRSMCFDRVIVKIENRTNYNKDFAFKVVDPCDAVKGYPIKNVNFGTLFE